MKLIRLNTICDLRFYVHIKIENNNCNKLTFKEL